MRDTTDLRTVPFALARHYLEDNGMRIYMMRQDYADMVARDDWRHGEPVLVHVYERNPRSSKAAHRLHAFEPPISEDDMTRLRSDCALFLAEHPKAKTVRVDLVGIAYSDRRSVEPSIVYDRDVVRLP